MLLSYIKAIKKRKGLKTFLFKEKGTQLVIGMHPKEDMKHKQGRKSYKVPVSMQRPIFVLLVLGIFYNLQAQPVRKPQFDKWVFPNFCQLDFTGGAPVFSKTGAAYVIESSGCYGDQSGNVLFYSDGVNMYDATHSIMPNGVLWSSAGGRMGPLIIPVIGSSTKYYAFQVDGGSTTFTQPACGPLARFDGLYYHIIDMTLNGGLGDIVAGRKNISLVDSTGESVIGMMHENGKDFWIIVRKAHSNNYYSFLVTQSGVCTTPVISSFTGGIPSNPRGLMTLAPSHDATQIAVSQGSTISGGLLQLFDFESCSGRLSNPTNISNSLRGWYDVAFSPNDSLIYATFTSGGFLNASFFQYERFAGNIPASQNTIGGSIPWGYHPNVLGYLGMRVYGDTLYIANADSSIHILETPNTVGSPGLITHWLHTAPFGSRVSYNFPNYFDYELDFKDISYVAATDTFVCPGDSVNIGNSNCDAPEYSYSWSPSTGLDFDTVPNPWAQPTVTTEYIVTVSWLCFSYEDTITVYAPNFTVSNDTTICIGDSTVLTASGGITYLWSNGDTTASTTVLPSVDTTYFVAITDSFCTITDSIVVSLATSVIADISPLTYSGCAPDTIAFTNSSNGTDYFWDFGNGDTSVLVSPTYIYTASGTYNGSLAAIDSSSCNVTDTVFFVVNISSLTVDAGPNTVICSGDSMVLTASGGISYLWSTGDTTASITVSPSVNTTYYVTGTDGICFTTDSVVVNVPSTVVADISPLTYSGCAPDTIAFTNNSNGTDYFWDFGNGDTSTQVSPTYTYTSAGTFNGSLVATDSSSCNIKDTITFVITISTLSVDAGIDVTICSGDSTVLTVSGGSTYLWDTGDTTASITVSPSVNTTYYVTGTDGICFTTDSVVVNVPSTVVADISPLTYSGCAPAVVIFTNLSNGTDYYWDFGNGDTSTQVSPTYTYALAGIFNGSLVATDTSSCNISDTITFVITLTIVTVDAGPNTTICAGDSTVLTVSGGGTYLWSTGDTTAMITVSPSVNTLYFVTGTDGICGHKDSVLVSLAAAVIADISPLTYSGCAPDTIAFTNNSNGTDYFWDFGNGDTSTQISPTYTYASAGTFNGILIATDSSSCNIKDTVTFVITISTLSIDAGADVTICNGDSTVLTASGGGTYLWSTGDTTASITVSPSSTANYIVTVTDGSCSGSDTAEVTVGQPPSAVTISGTTQLCEGSSITLTVQGAGPYMWSTGDTLASITVSPGSNTSYWVQSTNTCGTSSDTANIVVNQPPVLQVSDDTTISIGETVTLTASGAGSYLWSTGSASTSINVSPEQTATYTVTGTDSLGCSAEASVTVSISIDAFVYVPNVFSVMSDNLENNRLFVFGQNIKSLELIIYDRWGEKVYEASDPSKKMRSDGECCAYGEGWDGTYKNTGKPLNGSVFVFLLKGEFEDGGEFNESGNITFIE